MKNDPAMLAECVKGYKGTIDDAPYFSSPSWLALVAGQRLAKLGVSLPIACTMSRGFSVRVETCGATWLIKFIGEKLTPSYPKRIG